MRTIQATNDDDGEFSGSELHQDVLPFDQSPPNQISASPIRKVCTFPVRSYVQHKEALRGGCEIECKSRGGKPEILVVFRVQGWKLPRS